MSARLSILIAIAAAFGTACGFAGDAQFTAQELPDVTRFAADVPVEICDGATRFGAVSATPLGWCDFARATAKTCRDDRECGSRESCLCGACVVVPCDANDECGAGRICDFNDRRCDRPCAADSDCAPSELCLPGRNVCRGRCSSDGDCQGGERCDRERGRCSSDACSSTDECAACTLVRTPREIGEPSVIATRDGALELWFEERRADGVVIRRARGNDGVHFVAAPAIVTSGAEPSAVARPDGSVDLVWRVANDGLVAARFANDTLATPIALGRDGETYRAPTHRVADDDARVVFAVRERDGAIVTLDGSITLTAEAFVAPPYVLSATAIGSPFLEVADGVERLWLTLRAVESGPSVQFGAEVPTPENDSIALALRRPTDASFTPFPYNPVFARTESITMHPFERAPSTVVYRGVRWLYFERAGLDGTTPQNLRVTRSP